VEICRSGLQVVGGVLSLSRIQQNGSRQGWNEYDKAREEKKRKESGSRIRLNTFVRALRDKGFSLRVNHRVNEHVTWMDSRDSCYCSELGQKGAK
jgi:hypothetical protein